MPVLSLGLAGTFLTAGAIAAFAHFVLGMDWTLAGLLGAALAPTDPAVMFSVLGRREIGGRSGTTLEGEAGMNDPAGIALMLGMIELATHDDATVLVVGREFMVEMVVGAGVGLLGGRLLIPLLRRSRLPSESLTRSSHSCSRASCTASRRLPMAPGSWRSSSPGYLSATRGCPTRPRSNGSRAHLPDWPRWWCSSRSGRPSI